jgi:hypothetical protein
METTPPTLRLEVTPLAACDPARDALVPEIMNTRHTFQIEFAPGSDPRWGLVRGQVEHLAWGERTRFESLDQLLRFIGVTLRAMDRPGSPRRRTMRVGFDGNARRTC